MNANSVLIASAKGSTRLSRTSWILATMLGLLTANPYAQEAKAAQASVNTEAEESYRSVHDIVANGKQVTYAAIAEPTILKNEKGEPAASLFTFSYIRQGVKDEASRPVMFVFNGGPGSSSIWLHMSGLAPKRVVFDRIPGMSTSPPFKLADSEFSIIDATDLVFIDPVGTGFSKILPAGRAQDYYGLHEDARSIAEFMRIWITKNRRWNSPKYILGESYGTHRIGALMKALNTPEMTIAVNGLILLGQAMDMSSAIGNPGNDMSPVLDLPSIAATAWYHDKVDKTGYTFTSFLDEVRRFASSEYAAALFAGSGLKDSERSKVARQLSKFAGIKESVLLQWDLRVTGGQFATELLRDRNVVIDVYDGRFEEKVPGGGADDAAMVSPVLDQISPAIKGVFNDYLGSEFHAPKLDTYRVLNVSDISMAKWNSGHGYVPARAVLLQRDPDGCSRDASKPAASLNGGNGILRSSDPVLPRRAYGLTLRNSTGPRSNQVLRIGSYALSWG